MRRSRLSLLIFAIAFFVLSIGISHSIRQEGDGKNLGPAAEGEKSGSNSNSDSVKTDSSGASGAEGHEGALIISNQQCLNKCVGRDMCRWKLKNPTKKAACFARCHKECLVCPLTAVKGTCANKCKSSCKLGSTSQGTPEGMRCIHTCLEKCPCEDVSNELKDLIRLIPDSDMAIPFALSHKEHFNKKKPSGPSPKATSVGTNGTAPELPLEGLGFPIHLLPSVRSEVHKKPKASLMKMIKLAIKISLEKFTKK